MCVEYLRVDQLSLGLMETHQSKITMNPKRGTVITFCQTWAATHVMLPYLIARDTTMAGLEIPD